MIVSLTFFCSLWIVLLVTPMVHRLGKQWGMFDQPDARKLHHKPMVRMGGLAIALGTLLACGVNLPLAGLAFPELRAWLPITGVMLASISFFAIGFADDRWQLSPYWRLGLQAIVVSCTWFMGVQIHTLPIPLLGSVPIGIWSLPITFLWLAGVANAINWMDGMDGLATGVASITAGMFALLAWQHHNLPVMILALALAGAALGFWPYNRKPAQLYMGDGGSYFIGGLLAGIGVLSMAQGEFTGNAIPYLVLFVPIIDMVLVMMTRLLNRKSVFFPDQRHIHHRLLRLGLSQSQVVWTIYGLVLWAGLSANVLMVSPWGWSALGCVLGVMGVLNRTSLSSSPQETTVRTV
jgi:UDP-GlcNAc:undecaprenyl-phosphate/decaprenyl-phosphate GlcNAc-1-phosphate transferase